MLMPLVNCIVNDAVVYDVPNIQQMLLQFVKAMQLQLKHLLLNFTPYPVVDWIEVSAIRSAATDLEE